MNTFELIYAEVKKIPRGRVASYGYIACRLGNPRLSRVVGYALHVNPQPGGNGGFQPIVDDWEEEHGEIIL